MPSFKLPGNAPNHIKQRGISISKSNREHKLNVEKNGMSQISGIYQTEANIEDSRRTVASANTVGGN